MISTENYLFFSLRECFGPWVRTTGPMPTSREDISEEGHCEALRDIMKILGILLSIFSNFEKEELLLPDCWGHFDTKC